MTCQIVLTVLNWQIDFRVPRDAVKKKSPVVVTWNLSLSNNSIFTNQSVSWEYSILIRRFHKMLVSQLHKLLRKQLRVLQTRAELTRELVLQLKYFTYDNNWCCEVWLDLDPGSFLRQASSVCCQSWWRSLCLDRGLGQTRCLAQPLSLTIYWIGPGLSVTADYSTKGGSQV